MKIVRKLSAIPDVLDKASNTQYALTIGNFDGVHLGHQLLIKQLKEKVPEGHVALLTFSNHPSHILKNQPPSELICTSDHKISLLTEAGVDLLILLPFTIELAALSYDAFLKEVKKYYPFSYLMLGKGSTLGKGRQGDEVHVKELSKALGFQAHYIEKGMDGGIVISSKEIRRLIEKGDFANASALLGRPYSILAPIKLSDSTHGELSIEGLCLPPEGEYPLTVIINGKPVKASGLLQKASQVILLTFQSTPFISNGSVVELIFQ